MELTKQQARSLKDRLMNAPVAPGGLSPGINVGTDAILDALEEQYFVRQLADGISCFKYLEGQYGSGKTQFIQCLANRARRNNIATAIVSIGQDCPFSSPLAIFRNAMASFVPGAEDDQPTTGKGIEILFQAWLDGQLRQMGITPGNAVPDAVRQHMESPFAAPWLGAPDAQMASALSGLGRVLVGYACGASLGVADEELRAWVRGDAIRSNNLKQKYGLYEPTRDETAFQRLKTVVSFLRERLNFKGFLIAFDEGTRIMSFRRGTIKQRQAIENMLTMINQNAEGEFGGVMFVYAATPDFRTEVIQNYIALRDRIGSVAFLPGRPMTPFINLEDQNSDAIIVELGKRLLEVFEKADDIAWDRGVQLGNMEKLISAQKRHLAFTVLPPRFFVFNWCRFLAEQQPRQYSVSPEDAMSFVVSNKLADPETSDATQAR